MNIKITLSAVLISLTGFNAIAQQSRVQLFAQTPEKTVVRVLVNGFDWKTEGDAKVITLEDGTQIAKEGQPDLPMITVMVPAPAGENLIYNLAQNGHTDFENMTVATYGNKEIELIKYDNDGFNGFHPRTPIIMGEPLMIDGERMVMLKIYPLQYNPNLKVIRLQNEFVFTITRQQDYSNTAAVNTLANENTKPELTVYTNPALELLTVAYELKTSGNTALEIYSLSGQTVYSKNKAAQSACLQTSTIDVSGFAPGVYSLALRTDNGTSVKRVVVE